MRSFQPQVAGNVLPFRPRDRRANSLSARDRAEVAQWRDYAARVGFDRILIDACDSPGTTDIDEFVALHRCGEAWAQYLFSRKGGVVLAWCGVSSADIGEFRSLGEAFQHVLARHNKDAVPPSPPAHAMQNVVTDFLPRLRRAAGG